MSTAGDIVLATCEGGNDTLALVAILFGLLLYLVAALAPLVRAEGRDERIALLVLLVGSAVIGGFIFLGSIEIQRGEFLPGLLLSLVLAALVGLGVAQAGRTTLGRALWTALAGSAFAPGGLVLLLFATLGIGTGCLD